MLKQIAILALIACSLSACSTVELVHADIDLPCLPQHNVRFADGETDVMSDELFTKFETIILTYKQRILSQCEIAKKYNEEYNK